MKSTTYVHAALLVLVALLGLVGCSESTIESPAKAINAVINKAKTAVSGDVLPETNTIDAISNHSFDQLVQWAESGNAKAQYIVAEAYLKGMGGVPRNTEIAYVWLRRSANAGIPLAQMQMGNWAMAAIKQKYAVDSNMVRSYYWLILAEAGGNLEARKYINEWLNLYGDLGHDTARRGEALAAQWQPCSSKTCWDREIVIPPSEYCLEKKANNKFGIDCEN